MKNALLASVAAAAMITGTAYAADAPLSSLPDGFFFKPYVGADYDYYHVAYSSGNSGVFSNNFNGGDIHVGARVNRYLGFEASYFDTLTSDKSNVLGSGLGTSAKLDGEALDVMGYLPVSQRIELIGTAGVARTTASGSVVVSGKSYSLGSGSEYKGRFGAGAEYWFTDNLNVRGLVRYQDASFHQLVNNAVIASLGVNYQF